MSDVSSEPRYALFGGINRRSPGEEPSGGDFITAHATVWEAQDRAAYGNCRGAGLRWYAVVDRESGDVVAREDW